MKLLVVGTPADFAECRDKFGQVCDCLHLDSREEAVAVFRPDDVIFDFAIADAAADIVTYARKPVTVFLNTCLVTLSSLHYLAKDPVACTAFGFNGLRSMLNRQLFEVSISRQEDNAQLLEVCRRLNTPHVVVDDRVGLVTPRVICMIINEAYYTVQEGTATRADIDVAMKLGTNYPFGPFEWCKIIGVTNVYRLLCALYDDTQDERYKVCPLLKKEFLQARQSPA